MEKIEGLVKEDVINSVYNGNYIRSLKVKNNEYFNKLMNAYTVLKTNDGLYVAFELDTPSISKTLWFDDEKDIPSESEQLFIDYNIRTNLQHKMDSDRQFFFYKYGSFNGSSVVSFANHNFSWEDTIVRDMTDEELKEIKSIVDAYANKYIERLHKYWKRYGSTQVMTMGYWVNR